MSQFEKIKEWKTTRYYQNKGGCGIFLDVEKHRNKIKVYMGSILHPIDRGTIPPITQIGEVACNLLCHLDNQNEIVLKTFENVYQKYLNEYSFTYIFEDYSQPEDWAGRIETDDVSEYNVVRYGYKKFRVDFITVMNPQEDDNTITYVYILDKKADYKVFCDFFSFKLPEDKYEEMLESSIDEYIADFYCEVAGKPYRVEGHRNKDMFHEEKASDGNGSSTGNGLEKYMGALDEMIQELPFG